MRKYVGFPNPSTSYQESGVASKLSRNLSKAHGVNLEFNGVALHKLMGNLKQYHAPLRRIYRILADKHSSISMGTRLTYKGKELNDMAGQKGVVPSMLVFVVMHSLDNSTANIPDQYTRFESMK